MRILVLGGTHHVGRAVVEAALTRRDVVTTLTRGESGPPASDTWAWLQAEGLPAPAHPERGAVGMDAAAEARLFQNAGGPARREESATRPT